MGRLLSTGIVTAVAAALCAMPSAPTGAAGAARCPLPAFGPGATYRPVFHPAAHPARVTNPWYPLRRGTTWIYTGVEDGRRAVDVVVASRRTKVIGGGGTPRRPRPPHPGRGGGGGAGGLFPPGPRRGLVGFCG